MALADIAARMSDEVPWRTCATCHHLEQMSPADAKTLRALLADRGVRFKDLARELEQDPEAPTIPWEALSRHARGGCAARESLR